MVVKTFYFAVLDRERGSLLALKHSRGFSLHPHAPSWGSGGGRMEDRVKNRAQWQTEADDRRQGGGCVFFLFFFSPLVVFIGLSQQGRPVCCILMNAVWR